jgi:hypothetical protein
MTSFKHLDQGTRGCMIFIGIKDFHSGLRALTVNKGMQVEVAFAESKITGHVLVSPSAGKVALKGAIVTGDTSPVRTGWISSSKVNERIPPGEFGVSWVAWRMPWSFRAGVLHSDLHGTPRMKLSPRACLSASFSSTEQPFPCHPGAGAIPGCWLEW